jgi:putative transposase
MDTQRLPYPSDVTDEEWAIIEPFLPKEFEEGREREVDLREVVNGIFYETRSGCAWRMLPHDLPAWRTVYGYFKNWEGGGLWDKINDELRRRVRRGAGKKPEQTLGIADSQSVKSTESGGIRGFDGGKKVKGRKRNILVDTMGLLLEVFVHRANMGERAGLRVLARRAEKNYRGFIKVLVDGGYEGKDLADWFQLTYGWIMEVVKGIKGKFEILPKRWIVERTFAWLGKYRRLSKDYERNTSTSETFIKVAMIRLQLRRLTGRGYSPIGYKLKPCLITCL